MNSLQIGCSIANVCEYGYNKMIHSIHKHRIGDWVYAYAVCMWIAMNNSEWSSKAKYEEKSRKMNWNLWLKNENTK